MESPKDQGGSAATSSGGGGPTRSEATSSAEPIALTTNESKADEASDNMTTTSIPSLDAPYMYQNRRTGSASSAPLTVRQLCRLLCPPSAVSASASIVTPDSPVIGYNPVTGQYSSQGWVMARTVPVLREAGASWYYESSASPSPSPSGNGNDTATSQIKGPITARELSKLLNDEQDNEDNKNAQETTDIVDGLTRVWSSDIYTSAAANGAENEGDSDQQQQQQQWWRSISELPLLRMAMEAFEGSNPQWLESTTTKQKKQESSSNTPLSGNDDDKTANTQYQEQQTFDPTFDAGEDEKANASAVADGGGEGLSKQEADDLEAFLNSTAKACDAGTAAGSSGVDDDGEEEYESDGGTRYVRDAQTDNWIHEDLAPKKQARNISSNQKNKQQQSSTSAITVSSSDRTVHHSNKEPTGDGSSANFNGKASANAAAASRKRKKRGKFCAKNAKCWVYVTGLPFDASEDEVAKYFGRVGVLDLDPETQHPKVKLYRRRKGDDSGPEGSLKGDASVCYARAESVDLALQFLDESYFRADSKEKLRVQRAKFEQHGEKFEDRGKVSYAKRKVSKLAALQAVGWDEGENGRITGGRKGLCIIVLKGMFDLIELQKDGEDKVLSSLEQEIRKECEEWGDVEKITAFLKNPEGVVVVKFGQPTAASTAVAEYHGRMRRGRKIDCSYWDGVTDYTVREEEKEKKEESKRLDEFGKWLDEQDLPEEFRLKVEG